MGGGGKVVRRAWECLLIPLRSLCPGLCPPIPCRYLPAQTLREMVKTPQEELGGFLFRPIGVLSTCFPTCQGEWGVGGAGDLRDGVAVPESPRLANPGQTTLTSCGPLPHGC